MHHWFKHKEPNGSAEVVVSVESMFSATDHTIGDVQRRASTRSRLVIQKVLANTVVKHRGCDHQFIKDPTETCKQTHNSSELNATT
jgi:hypothetical protein